MGAKISKFASIKVATQCSVAFSKLMRWCKTCYKDFKEFENCDMYFNYIYCMFKKVVSLYNLQRCFYPLDVEDYLTDEIYYFGADWCRQTIGLCIKCIHPLMLYYSKLDNHNCSLLIQRMKEHLYALIYEDLGVLKDA